MWIPTVRPEEEKSVKLGLYVGNCFFALWVDPKHTTISLRGGKNSRSQNNDSVLKEKAYLKDLLLSI